MNTTLDINLIEKEIMELELSLKIRESWLNREGSGYNYFRQRHLYDSKRLLTLKKMAEIMRFQLSVS